MAKTRTISSLLEDEVKDLYSAESQLLKALPKMIKGSSDASLQAALKSHLKETEVQVQRLKKVAEILNVKPTGKKCVGMEGCIKEGAEALEETGEGNVIDLGIIGAGTRVEHYEMAGYMTAISLAQRVGAKEVVQLLGQSLAEEQAAEAKLRQLATTLLKSSAVDQQALRASA